MIIETFDSKQTYELGYKLGCEAKAGDIYCLDGELGVGKTVFTQGFAKGRSEGEAVGLKKGEAVGLKKGEAVGLKKGEAQKQREIAKNLKALNLTKEQIAAATGLSTAEIEKL